MIKFTDVKLTYTCPAAPPEGLFMDRIYTDMKTHLTQGLNLVDKPNC